MSTVSVNPRLEGLEYRFSLDRLGELNRSPIPLLLARLNRTCPSYGKAAADVDNPIALLTEIRNNCADDSDYIRESMPLQEIVFRTLLVAEDQTLTLGELHYELTERWSSPIRPITVTVAGLSRILDSDTFYGFEMVAPPEPEGLEPEPPMLLGAGVRQDDPMRGFISTMDDDDDFLDDDEDDPYEEDDEELEE